MQTLLDVILPVFCIVGFGYVATWRGLFSLEGSEALMKFTQHIAIPCLLFQAISGLDIAANFDVALLLTFYTSVTICFCLGAAGAYFAFGRGIEDSIAIGVCAMFSNTVLLGLPITERAYGTEALGTNYAIIAFHAPFCYLLGITAMELVRARGQSSGYAARMIIGTIFRNALFLAIMLGLIWNVFHLPIPNVLDDALDLMARAALPTALFALGGVLIRYRPEGDMKAIAMVCAITLLVQPMLVFGLGMVAALPPDVFKPAVLTAAMAPGVNAFIFADMYGHARRVAASAILLTTALTVLTAWLWLSLLG